MPKRRLILIALIVGTEAVAITFLGQSIYQKMRSSSISVMYESELSREASSTFKHFFEPKSDILAHNGKQSWLTKEPVYTINSDTLLETKNYAVPKPRDTYRILALGDSFTYGLNVEPAENWTTQLETILNAECRKYGSYEVVNFGMTGYDIQFAVERFRIRGQKYDPDLVVWFLKDDDFDIIEEEAATYVEEYRKEHGITGAVEPAQATALWKYASNRLYAAHGLKGIADFQAQALRALNRFYSGPLVIFSLPQLISSGYGLDTKGMLGSFTASRPVSHFILLPTPVEGEDDILPDSHPSARGHEKIAHDLFSYLTRSAITPCN